MDEVRRVKCNWCDSVFNQNELKYDLITEEDYCPVCKHADCLMDIETESDNANKTD